MECFGVLVVVVVIAGICFMLAEQQKERLAQMTPEEREKYLAAQQESNLTFLYGPINPTMVCPHCQEKGKIRTKHVVQKKGVSGGKAAAALITGGLSVLATGLSRKETNTQAYCDNCRNTWFY